jgi:RNA polymerase sigma-70 factor (ECF subfamily)
MTSAGELVAASDEELVAAFVAGQDRAFDLLVQRYSQRVYAICFRYFGNEADAEDAAQDTFVALLRRAGTFKGASSFATWMYRVATNACNDLARKRSRRPQLAAADIEFVADEAGAAAGVEDELAAGGLGDELVAALRELDHPTREAVVLHDVYGMPYAEIAQRSDVAVGTVKSRVHRGHARLASALRREDAVPREPSERRRPQTLEP